jgi:hypothetical protein
MGIAVKRRKSGGNQDHLYIFSISFNPYKTNAVTAKQQST